MLDPVLLLVFPAAMALAACFDFFTMTIPNRLTVGFAAAFLVAAAFAGMPLAEFGQHLLAGLAMLAVAFTLFALGWIGGGDAKFFAATATWLGWSHLIEYAFWFSLLGGGLTLLILFARRVPLPMPLGEVGWVARLHDARQGIPYGIALAAAGLVVYPATLWMTEFGGP